jgi:hypothetical protein
VKCIGKYELGGTIGEGTFSKVRFAENIRDWRSCSHQDLR